MTLSTFFRFFSRFFPASCPQQPHVVRRQQAVATGFRADIMLYAELPDACIGYADVFGRVFRRPYLLCRAHDGSLRVR